MDVVAKSWSQFLVGASDGSMNTTVRANVFAKSHRGLVGGICQ